MELPTRWFEMKPHPEHQRLKNSKARFAVVPAGRRAYKSELSKRRLIMSALNPYQRYQDARYFAAAPTRLQAKQIFWEDLRRLSPSEFILEESRSELWIRYITGATIHVAGLNVPQRMEGRGWDGGIIDELADCPPHTFEANIRPALADRGGWCWLIGVPNGRGWFYDIYSYARQGDDPEWDAFTWISADVLPDSEIQSARRSMDARTFKEEFEANFLSQSDRVYYAFGHDQNCHRLTYDPSRPLMIHLDFNIAPGVAAITQELFHPRDGHLCTCVIDEVYIEYDSHTEKVCQELASRWRRHENQILVFGDATGGAKTASSVIGSSWDLAKRCLLGHFGGRVKFCIPRENPKVKHRINAMNSRICSSDGKTSLLVDPVKAPHMVKDFEGVGWLPGTTGEIDKAKYPELTHLSDALGYGVHYLYPVDKTSKTEVRHTPL